MTDSNWLLCRKSTLLSGVLLDRGPIIPIHPWSLQGMWIVWAFWDEGYSSHPSTLTRLMFYEDLAGLEFDLDWNLYIFFGVQCIIWCYNQIVGHRTRFAAVQPYRTQVFIYQFAVYGLMFCSVSCRPFCTYSLFNSANSLQCWWWLFYLQWTSLFSCFQSKWWVPGKWLVRQVLAHMVSAGWKFSSNI